MLQFSGQFAKLHQLVWCCCCCRWDGFELCTRTSKFSDETRRCWSPRWKISFTPSTFMRWNGACCSVRSAPIWCLWRWEGLHREGDNVYYGRSREYPPPTSEQAKWIRIPRGFYWEIAWRAWERTRKSTVPNQPLQFSGFLNSADSFDEKNQYI